jgi:hypothetical protein
MTTNTTNNEVCFRRRFCNLWDIEYLVKQIKAQDEKDSSMHALGHWTLVEQLQKLKVSRIRLCQTHKFAHQ